MGSLTKIVFLRIACIGLCLSANSGSMAQESPGTYLHELRNLVESIESAEALLAKYPDNDFAPNLMFQLSELYIKRSTLKFQREMLLYEDAEELYSQGSLTQEPVAPQVDFSDATRTSLRLLNKFPTAHFRDKVLYRVALCYSEEGKPDKAMEYFRTLSEETNDSQLLEESYFRLGEYFFDKQDYPTTIDYYSRLLESWDSPFFDMALYKLGWSYYNVENYNKAISTFIYLVEDINLLNEVDTEKFETSKADLHREAIEYVASCFSEFGGPEKARTFLLGKKDKDYAEDVLEHLAHLYQERGFFADAIATLKILIEFYPGKAAAAFYQKQIVENFDRAGEKKQADIEREKLVDDYGPGSDWIQLIGAVPEREEILLLAEGFLYQLGTEAQARAQAGKDNFAYDDAVNYYQSYMAKFSAYERAYRVQFYLSECYYEQGEFQNAANAYYELHLNYPESEFSETAAYNRVLAYNHLLQADTSSDSTDFFLFNFLGKSETGVEILKALNGSQAQLMQAGNDFFVFHPESPKANEVMMNLAQLLFELEQFGLAKQVYQEALARAENNSYLAQAHYMMAQCEFRQDHFEDAQTWFVKTKELFPDSLRFVKPANKMIALAQFRRAETFVSGGDSLLAAEEFERVAGTAPDSAIAERALFEAAKQFETAGDKARAVELYERVTEKFPQSKSLDRALFMAGFLAEDLQQWERAAANYLKLYRLDRFSDYAPKSLFFAAKCYENIERFDLAREYYQEYVDAYIQDPDRYMEAAFRKAEIAFNQGESQTALKDLRFVLKAFQRFSKTGIPVEEFIPANAQFLIAEITFKTFKGIQLTRPLRRKLKRKRTMFQQVVKAYTAAAKFKVAEWTTASSYKIGQAFESFADALYESPRPEKLKAGDLVKYNQKLREQVLPFKQKALETYAANIKNAEDNSIENEWISESLKRLEVLSMELNLSQLNAVKEPDS